MPAYKKPIRRSMLSCVAAFVSLLCPPLSIQSCLMVSRSLYARHEERLTHVLAYVEDAARTR